jgi:hypothetical protein
LPDALTNEITGRRVLVFGTNEDHILISADGYGLARSRYGLTTNQWFVGKVRSNIFYWETGKPNIVYYRTKEEKRATHYFKLPKSVSEIEGVTKAMRANKDVGFCTIRESNWFQRQGQFWLGSAGPDSFVEVEFKKAKQVKSGK